MGALFFDSLTSGRLKIAIADRKNNLIKFGAGDVECEDLFRDGVMSRIEATAGRACGPGPEGCEAQVELPARCGLRRTASLEARYGCVDGAALVCRLFSVLPPPSQE